MKREAGTNGKSEATVAGAVDISTALRLTLPAFSTAIIFSFFINLLLFVGPIYMLQVYDRVLSSRSETTLIGLTVLAAALIAVYAILEALRSRVLVRAGVQFDQRIAEATFSAVHRGHLRRPTAGFAQCIRDVDTVREFLTGSGLITACDAPWFPVFVFASFLLHPWFGYIAIGATLLTLGLTFLNDVMTRHVLGQASQQAMRAQQRFASTVRNAEVMQAMGMTKAQRSKWAKEHRGVLAWQARASDRAGVIQAMTKFLRVFMQTAVLGTGAYLAINREISAGSMIAASIIIGRALQPIELAVGNWKGLIAARAAYGRLKQLFAEVGPEERRVTLPRPTGALTAASVAAVVPGSMRPGVAPRPVLAGVSFTVGAGEIVGVIGPSAAGKSCLARVLTGVWPVSAGSLRLDGSELAHWDPQQLGPCVGYLPQDVELFGGTAAENIARQPADEGTTIDEAAVIAAAQLAGCHEMIQALPNGYNTEIGEAGQVLSGGQRQRLGLARALFGEPCFVVLDEPNANLDSAGEAALLQALQTLRARRTTVVIMTHKMNVLATVDKILVMQAGTVQAFGPRDEILAQLAGPRVVRTNEAQTARMG